MIRSRRTAGLAAAAVVVALLAAVLGLDVPHAAALGAAGLAVALLLAEPSAPAEPEEGDGGGRPPGGSAEVEETAWGLLDRDGRLRFPILERLRRLAAVDPDADRRFAGMLADGERRPGLAELDRALQPADPTEGPR